MRDDPALDAWSALRARFRRRVYEVPADIWDHLLDRLSDDPRKSQQRMIQASKRHSLEREIESRLAGDLSALRPHGLELGLHARQHVCRHGGRADLVCHDERMGRRVVIELKRGLGGRDAVAQVLSYRSSIGKEFPDSAAPLGVLVAERLDNEAWGMIADDDRLMFIPLDDLWPEDRRTS